MVPDVDGILLLGASPAVFVSALSSVLVEKESV